VLRAPGVRRWLRSQVRFTLEDVAPFEPYPANHAFPLFEWGLNWAIATGAYQYLMLHSAVVERGGQVLILPALPGSGKTTLCARLIQHGWRLLSDEFGLVDHRSGAVQPLPRALPLKNRSIDIMAERGLADEIGPRFEKTRKGTVAHLRPPRESLRRQHETAQPGWIVFPRYIAGHPTRVLPLEQSVAFTRLAQNSFNYRLLGATGFKRLCPLILDCPCYSMEYSSLDEALTTLDDLTDTSADADG
jgi:HprK-related kinase A